MTGPGGNVHVPDVTSGLTMIISGEITGWDTGAAFEHTFRFTHRFVEMK